MGGNRFEVAKVQIATISYKNEPPSPRNVFAPDLGSSLNRPNPLLKNQNIINLGLNDMDRNDGEAQRNRNINMSDLQSLFV
jgi:hypothetical protein